MMSFIRGTVVCRFSFAPLKLIMFLSISFASPCPFLFIPVPYSSHLQDLKEITHDYLYENYRTEKLSRSADNISE